MNIKRATLATTSGAFALGAAVLLGGPASADTPSSVTPTEITRDESGTPGVYGASYDSDGDGFAESQPVDTNADGVPDLVLLDTNKDGMADSNLADTNYDGVIDTKEIDTDGDNVADVTYYDHDQNGDFETSGAPTG